MRGDLDLAGLHLLHRMIAAMVPKSQLVSFAAQRDADQLVSKTDAEDGHAPHHPANTLLGVSHGLGIARAVRQEYAVGLESEYVLCAGGGGNHGHAAALAHQASHDVVLDSVVVGDDVMPRRPILHADHFRRLVRAHAFVPLVNVASGDFFGEIGAIHLRNGARLGDEFVGVGFQGGDHAAHHAVSTQMANQSAGVDLAHHGNLVALEIVLSNLLRPPVGADARKLAHDQSLDVRTRGFVVVGVGAVIADFGIGENYDLPGVGGIGEDFLVAGDGGVKNNFPVTFAFCAVAFAVEDPSIFQRKDCLHCISGVWILLILSGNARQHKRASRRIYSAPDVRHYRSLSSLATGQYPKTALP